MDSDVFNFEAAGQCSCGFIKALFNNRQETANHLLVVLLHWLAQLYTVNNLAIICLSVIEFSKKVDAI